MNRVEVMRPTTTINIAKVLSRPVVRAVAFLTQLSHRPPRRCLCRVPPVVLQGPQTRGWEWKGQEGYEQLSYTDAFVGCVTSISIR